VNFSEVRALKKGATGDLVDQGADGAHFARRDAARRMRLH